MKAYKILFRDMGVTLLCLAVYIIGIRALAALRVASWIDVPVYWVGMAGYPAWTAPLSLVTVAAGTMLIYFIPGVFIAKYIWNNSDAPAGLWAKGFLINYFFYFVSSSCYKVLYSRPFSREAMLILMAALAGIAMMTFFFSKIRSGLLADEAPPRDRDERDFTAVYVGTVLILLILSWKSFLIAHFGGDGDGVEQFWAAESVKSMMLPTSYRELYTIIPQFSFAPSVYLNMFALTLFGQAEFILKIQIITAFICIGFILKELVITLSGEGRLALKGAAPMILYMAIFFLVLCYRTAYLTPTDIAKGNETLQILLFLCGFYILARYDGERYILPAVYFLLAAMVRHNGLIMITVFLGFYSLLFRRYRCLAAYLIGGAALILAVVLMLRGSQFGFTDMVRVLLEDMRGLRQTTENASFPFVSQYIGHYVVLTAGMAAFLVLGIRNKYVLVMFLTTAIYFLQPIRSIRVPAHFYIPVFFFPVVAYYTSKIRQRDAVLWVVIAAQIAALIYVFPKEEVRRPESFIKLASSVCANEANPYIARDNFRKITQMIGLYVDERVVMYYGDMFPKEGKRYDVFYGMPREGQEGYARIQAGDGSEVYLSHAFMKEYPVARQSILDEYYSGNEPYIIYRKAQGE